MYSPDFARSYTYKGKHRAESHTSIRKAAVAATTVGAAVAVPLIGSAGVADAAPASAWNAVAACESSGDWHINTGNGFYGGLQFTQSTWDAYGGGAYASRADFATPDQQMAIANKVLAGQGWVAWPVCSQKAGVTGYSASGPTTAPQSAPQQSAPQQQSAPVHHASSSDSEPDGDADDAAPAASSSNTGSGSYTVVQGDTLFKIAAAHGVSSWQEIYNKNRSTIGGDPNMILVGQHLSL